MNNWEVYKNLTDGVPPRENVVKFVRNNCDFIGNAIDLGCGAGNDTVFLIKNNWNVLAIDGTDCEEQIRSKLLVDEQDRLTFEVQNFEKLSLKLSDLIVANNSLPFCNRECFYQMWNEIVKNIKCNGYFVGNFFGVNDEWNVENTCKTFLSREEALELFNDFEIVEFNEIEANRPTARGVMKHWHVYNVIAKKKCN